MSWNVTAIGVGGLKSLISQKLAGMLSENEIEWTLQYASVSSPLLVGMYGDEFACLVGFVAPTFLSDSAYVWLFTTDTINHHKLIFGRHSKRYIKSILGIYTRIHGHCLADNDSSIKWVKSLGGKFDEPKSGLAHFVIGE